MGNEASAPLNNYGKGIENDIKVVWTQAKTCPFEPREGQACASVGNKLYVFGGVTCSAASNTEREVESHESNQLLVFDIDSNAWEEVRAGGEIPEPRSGSTMAAVEDKLYVFGGLSEYSGWLNDLYVFDTGSKTWEKIRDMDNSAPSPRDKLSSAAVGKDIYYFGGFGPDDNCPNGFSDDEIAEDDGDEEYEDEEVQEVQQAQNAAKFTWFNSLFRFDTASKLWSKAGPQTSSASPSGGAEDSHCPSPRAAHTMCVVDQSLLVFGGRDSIGRQNDIWAFSLADGKWTEVNPLGCKPAPRSFHAAVSVSKRLVVCGGRSISNDHFKDFHIFDAETGQWFQPAVEGDVPPNMGMHTLCVVNESIVLCGGTSLLDPVTNSCSQYHSECYTIRAEDILKGKGVVNEKEEPHSEEQKENLPAFLNLKPTNVKQDT